MKKQGILKVATKSKSFISHLFLVPKQDGFFATPRLALQNRLVPGLFSSEHKEVSSALPSPNIQPRATRNDMPTVWVKHSSQNLRDTYKLGGTNVARQMEDTDSSVSRRLPSGKSKLRRAARACRSHSGSLKESRMASKLQEVCLEPPEKHKIFRGTMGSLGQLKIFAKRKSDRNNGKSNPDARTANRDPEGTSETDRITKLCQFCCNKGSAHASSAVTIHEFSTEPNGEALSTSSGGIERVRMVDGELSFCKPATLPSSDALLSHRCIRSSLGSTNEQCNGLGNLVAEGTKPALQPEGNVSDIICSPKSGSGAVLQFGSHTMRQQDNCCLLTQGRRHEIKSVDGNNVQDFQYLGPAPDTHEHSLYPRQIQQSGRSSVPSSVSSRMAPLASLYKQSICQVGDSNRRPVCIGDGACSLQLCVSRFEGSKGLFSRRLQCPVELSTCMGLSSTFPYAKSLDSPKPVDGNILIDNTSVETGVLARRPEGASLSATVDSNRPTEVSSRHVDRASTTASRGNNFGGLEMWGWTEEVENWTTDQISLLKGSWRKSTIKTYEAAWKRWVSWSNSKQIDSKNPTGSQLAQFLSDLCLIHKLSYNTILLHKSVVSTLCNPDSSSHLSSHSLVKHILKSISLRATKPIRPPVWDVSTLLNYLKNYEIDFNSTFQIARHTAILLLLCSGRRIHDLTLLTIDADHYIRSQDSVIFWPQFGSKTDSCNYTQSGWRIFLNNENHKLNPIFWIEQTITALQDRRSAAKTDNLFITTRGQAKPASRTVIAGWVKTLFKEAKIIASPGSVRAAVASKSWLDNNSLEDILARGNWRSANTFQKFYRREVMKNSNSENITQLFVPIN
ncbi:unnamed protein product [Colias eurytheme]|nr:unnamed protein product [Colias eurytheme]